MSWQERAACHDMWWLMDPGPKTDPALVKLARSRCLTLCPVTVQCLSWALSLGDYADPECIAGGTTAQQRRRLRAELHDHLRAQQGAA